MVVTNYNRNLLLLAIQIHNIDPPFLYSEMLLPPVSRG